MSEGFLSQVFSTIIAGVLAATAALDAPAPPADKDKEPGQHSARSLADKAEESLKNADEQPTDNPSVAAGPRGRLGRDVSWPQCPTGMGIPARRTLGLPMPPAGSSYVIIGLTNGPAFYPNPCLAEQVAYARELNIWAGAYAVVTYPTSEQLSTYGDAGPYPSTTQEGQLKNTGWAQAQVNIKNMRAAGLDPPIMWIDVEPVRPPAPWSGDVEANRAVVEGSMRAYRVAGMEVGVYSTAYLWESIVGPADYGLPEWRAAGPTSKARALSMCTDGEIQGGEAVLGQWSNSQADFNVVCPGRPAYDVLQEYFTLL